MLVKQEKSKSVALENVVKSPSTGSTSDIKFSTSPQHHSDEQPREARSVIFLSCVLWDMIFIASLCFCFSCVSVPQADLPALLLAHLPAGDSQLFGDDVRHQPRVLVGQHRPPLAAAALPPLQIAHQQLGLHQPGAHLPSGIRTRTDRSRIRRAACHQRCLSFWFRCVSIC